MIMMETKIKVTFLKLKKMQTKYARITSFPMWLFLYATNFIHTIYNIRSNIHFFKLSKLRPQYHTILI